jgi:hypothetical protein
MADSSALREGSDGKNPSGETARRRRMVGCDASSSIEMSARVTASASPWLKSASFEGALSNPSSSGAMAARTGSSTEASFEVALR